MDAGSGRKAGQILANLWRKGRVNEVRPNPNLWDGDWVNIVGRRNR